MEDPARLLHERGLQVTAQRLAVLRAVTDHPHCTADNVAEAVRAEIGAISRQAVYDALRQLTETRLVRRIQLAGSPALYERQLGDNHDHVVCRVCGRTADVESAVGEAPCRTAAKSSGFEVEEAEVVYWGTCPDCLARETEHE
jgi:Fur family ferric uptake transcriptional regulator